MPQDAIRVFAGDCTVHYDDESPRELRGAVVVLVKPDNTVLVHDRDGYRPAAWLTRADTVSWARDVGGVALEAAEGDRRLRVTCHAEYGHGHYHATPAGRPVGDCPACGGALVDTGDDVRCLECDRRHAVPRDADVDGDVRCDGCGLPTMRVERGAAFDLCVDRTCQPLDDQVRERFDREWPCPACDADLRILRRGGLIAGCENYPACEVGFAIPSGTVAGTCDACGLPAFDVSSGRRCLDATCPGPTESRS